MLNCSRPEGCRHFLRDCIQGERPDVEVASEEALKQAHRLALEAPSWRRPAAFAARLRKKGWLRRNRQQIGKVVGYAFG